MTGAAGGREGGRDPSRQRDVDAFDEALERPAGERRAFVEERFADDPERAARLLRLLDAHDRAERAEPGTPQLRPIPTPPATEPPPERIGPYRILEVLGEGGMGVVYAAEQTEPIRRRVAIKVVRLGMDTAEVLARFEAERQALAMMDHPGVAKVLDAGVTPRGRPYFVMELVKGLSLTEYCAKQRLPLPERLKLFTKVCAAMQHAHQKGIIHRDLKPSNILVTAQEGQPLPKVIDFGVAKATGPRLTEKTLFTEQGRLIGTLEYMSPEQAGMSGLDVDTRTDVYALGVVLYELITGVLPFDRETLRSGSYPEMLRTIREVDPPRPSARLAALARDAEAGADRLFARARSARGELDWIVMRAIEKDRTRRYGTAAALGEDVERHLTDRPVLAGPPSVTYSLRKFVVRHRFVTAGIGLALVSALVGFTGLATGLMRAREAELLATRRAENAQAAADFLEEVLFQADPEFAGGSPTLLEVMASAGRAIDADLGPYPEVEASVRESLGVAYRRRSMYPEAAPHLRRSLELRRGLFGELHPETAHAYVALSNLVFEQTGDVDEAARLLDRAADAYAASGLAGTIADAWLQLDVGLVALAADRLSDAERAFARCRAGLESFRGDSDPDVSRPVRGLALVASRRGEHAEAERLARRAAALCEVEGARYIGGRAKLVLGEVLVAAGRPAEAVGELANAGDRIETTVQERHVRLAEWQARLADTFLATGDTVGALGRAEAAESMLLGLVDPDHWTVAEARLLQWECLAEQGRAADAEAGLREVDEQLLRHLVADHPLRIRAVRARLACAEALDDAAQRAACEAELAELEASRAERLRSRP